MLAANHFSCPCLCQEPLQSISAVCVDAGKVTSIVTIIVLVLFFKGIHVSGLLWFFVLAVLHGMIYVTEERIYRVF